MAVPTFQGCFEALHAALHVILTLVKITVHDYHTHCYSVLWNEISKTARNSQSLEEKKSNLSF